MKKIRITAVFGTRPEAIKMCPLINEMKKCGEIDVKVVLTGQHMEIADNILDFFGVKAKRSLGIMKENQSLFDITENILKRLKEELLSDKPDYIAVHGDTSSAFAAALCGFYLNIPVMHIEAGLRSYDAFSPYPEEFNRVAIDRISSLHFCPTEQNKINLLKEGICADGIFVTGNTVIDTFAYTLKDVQKPCTSCAEREDVRIKMLMTVHRRESFGNKMVSIFKGVKRAISGCENLEVLFPMHPNPAVKTAFDAVFPENTERLTIKSPLCVQEFHKALFESDFVLSDSGGVQEEAIALHVPLILVRENTERPEGVECGGTILAGWKEDRIEKEILELCRNKEKRMEMGNVKNPYGKGDASKQITKIILSLCK